MTKTILSLLFIGLLVTAGFYFISTGNVSPDLFSPTKDAQTNTAASPKSDAGTSQKPKAAANELLSAIENKPLAPDFRLPDDEGDMHALSDYKGKTVIINFWATWCPPCRAELPSMNRAWKKLKDHNVQMLALNVGEDEDTVFAFTGEQEIDFQILLDQSGEVANQWPMRGLPTTYIVNKEGQVVYRAIGGREWDSDEIINLIKGL
jgi:peroxiredoxin